MEQHPQHYVYRPDVIEFVTIGVQTCLLLEHTEEQSKRGFTEKLLHYLPLLYMKARILTPPEPELDGYPQRFVTEEDYNYIAEAIKRLLGADDAYLEVFVDEMRYSDEPITAFVSENLADIYQELKDLAFNYQQQDEPAMNDSVLACIEAFHEHWGQKLLNTLRALHALAESETFGEEEKETGHECHCGEHDHCHCEDEECDCAHHHGHHHE